MTSPPGAPSIFARQSEIFCWRWNWNYAFVGFTEYNGPPDLRSRAGRLTGGRTEELKISTRSPPWLLAWCWSFSLMFLHIQDNLAGKFTCDQKHIICIMPLHRTDLKERSAKWSDSEVKKLDIAQCDRQLWSIVRTMSGYVENQFVSGLKIDPMLRSYQVAMQG